MQPTEYTYYTEYTAPKDPSKKFIIRSLVPSDVNEAVELMVETHELCHPMMVCFPYKKDIYTEMLQRTVSKTVPYDLSTGVFEKDSNKMVGLVYAEDLTSGRVDNSDLVKKWPEFEAYIECISALKNKHPDSFKVSGPGEGANVFYMTVKVEAQQYGLATQLVRTIIDHPKLSKYSRITGIAVSAFTIKICDKFKAKGETMWYDVLDYETFKDSKGNYPFAEVKVALKAKNLSTEHLGLTMIHWERPQNKSSEADAAKSAI